jgi:predicted nucleic acid-binding protein
MNAVDTNVLLYVHDPADKVKQAKAAALVFSLTPAVMIWQVACEYIAASRKLAPYGFRQEDAWKQLKQIVNKSLSEMGGRGSRRADVHWQIAAQQELRPPEYSLLG